MTKQTQSAPKKELEELKQLLDQKNRELEIEAALEQVRVRAMAMQKSTELSEVAAVLYEQLDKLHIQHLMTGYVLVDETNKRQEAWLTDMDGNRMDISYLPLLGDEVLAERYKNWKQQVSVFYQVVKGEKLRKHIEFVVSKQTLSIEAEDIAVNKFPNQLVFYCFNFSHGYLHIHTEHPLSHDNESILARLTQAFSMAYTRFLDLQKAEEQAKEAQIEAGIERVRAKSMAMHHTSELLDTAAELFRQLKELGIQPWRCGLAILNEDETKFEFWSETTTPKGRSVSISGSAGTSGHVHVTGALNAIKKNEDFYIYDLTGQDLIDYIQFITKDFNLPEASQNAAELPERLVYYCAIFSRGVLYGAFLSSIENSEKQILKIGRAHV